MSEEAVMFHRELLAEWNYHFRMSAETPLEQFEESLSMVGDLYETFDGFLRPREIRYVIKFSETTKNDFRRDSGVLRAIRDDDYGHTSIVEDESITDVERTGITCEEFTADVRQTNEEQSGNPWFTRISFRPMDVALHLNGDRRFIGVHDDLYRYKDGSNAVLTGLDSPVTVWFWPGHRNRSDDDEDHEFTVRTRTDIWMEDSDRGRVNRERFGAFLDELSELLDPHETEITGDVYSKPSFEREGLFELIPDGF